MAFCGAHLTFYGMLYWFHHQTEESTMTDYLYRVLGDTKRVLSTRWSARELFIPSWAVLAILYLTVLRSLAYGIELLVLGSAAAGGPFIAFISIMGAPTWGILMLSGVVVLLIGLLLRNTILVTIGSLMCAAVWSAFTMVVCLGWIGNGGAGGRYVVAAFATAVTWIIFFYLQLKTIKMNGVRS